MARPTLRRRVYLLLLRWTALLLIGVGLVSLLAAGRFREAATEERLVLARTNAPSLERTQSATPTDHGALTELLDDADLDVGGPAAGRDAILARLRAARFRSPFHRAIYVLDERHRVLVSDPAPVEPLPREVLPEQGTFTAAFDHDGRRAVALVQPFRHDGRRWLLVAEMALAGSALSEFLQQLEVQPDRHIVVVDARGTVIAAADRRTLLRAMPGDGELGERILAHRTLVSRLEGSPLYDDEDSRLLSVMVPLQLAPWGVVVQQHEATALAAWRIMRRGSLIVIGLLVLAGVWLARALTRSVVQPLDELSGRAARLRAGDLGTPIDVEGDHEVRLLAGTLEAARGRLRETLGSLSRLNENLEAEVRQRTRRLEAQYDSLSLLHAVSLIAAREPDRDRLAPRVLGLIAKRYHLREVALLVTPPGEPRALYVHPRSAALAWDPARSEPPAGWVTRPLDYRGERQGVLLHPELADSDPQVVEALSHQLAVTLRGVHLWRQTREASRQRKELVRRLLGAAEEERRRIARELHDEIAQLLTVVQLSVEAIPGRSEEAARARDLLARAQRDVHRVVHDLRPSLLDDLGLAAAIRSHTASHLEEHGISVGYELEELSGGPEVDVPLFRIFQEIVTNVLRHARAERVSIELYQERGRLVLAVEDDGAGFDPVKRAGGVGLIGMRERAALAGGSLRIDSEPGQGTRVVVEIPLEPR